MNFAERRKQVFEKMERQSVLILFSGIESHVSADEYAPFEADRNFFYLTGLRRDHMILLMKKTLKEEQVILFIEEANDLLQETSLKALDNEDKYMPDTNFKGWMYTIMRNIFINNYRKVVRDQTFIDQTDNLYHLNLPQDTGFESTERTYDLKEMHRVVNALPKEYRVPFAMHVSGFKYREIAEKLNLPLGTVKSRIFFTRQKLQEELKDFR